MPKRVLIIDDEVGATRMLKANLERTGRYTVATESRPEEALATALLFKPEVILLDFLMPGMSGSAVAAMFKAHEQLRTVPIIVFTAALGRRNRGEASDFFRNHTCLPKPASVEEIMRCIDHQFIGQTAASPETPGPAAGA